MVDVYEDYAAYVPPGWVRPTVDRLLLSLSPSHVNGLAAVVLTDSTRSDGRKHVRRARKNRRGVAVGRYHPTWTAHQPWIEIVVDRAVLILPQGFRWFQIARDFVMADVLFHEIGHHLHATVGSAARNGEPSAEDWRLRLSVVHFKRRYWYLLRVVPMLHRFARMMAKLERARYASREMGGSSKGK